MTACGDRRQANKAASVVELSAINYSNNIGKVLDAFISDYRSRARHEADLLADSALASITHVVNGKKVVDPDNMMVIMRQKAKQYEKIEHNVVEMRNKILVAHKDIEHIIKYSRALQEYFNTKTTALEMMNESSETVISILDAFVKKEGN